MDSTFSKALNLSGMSSVTSLVVWIMSIFLILLIVGIAFFFQNQRNSKHKRPSSTFPDKGSTGKGF